MTITFNHIPTNLRVPLFYGEVDNSRANTAANVQRTLIIGQKTNAGTGTANVPVQSQGVNDAKAIGGPGSMLADMVDAYRQNDTAGEVWYLPLADASGGATAAAGSVAFSGPSTAQGVLNLYVAGRLIAVALASAMTAAQIATAVAAAIEADGDAVVTAAVDGVTTSQVNITAKNVGICGNDIDIRINYLGTAGGESTPPGVGVTIVAMSGGTVNPTLTTALANLQDMEFDFIVSPYTDSTSTTAITAFLNDTTGRWAWSRQIYGHCFVASRGTSGTLTTFGATLNDPHLSVLPVFDMPSPTWRVAAAVVGAIAPSIRADAALPLQTLAVLGLLPPPVQSQFPMLIRNTLLYAGISTLKFDALGNVAVEKIITTYQTNGQGQPDNSYLEVETLYTIAFVLRFLRNVVETKFARMKLVDDGTRIPANAPVVAPKTIRAELIAGYRSLEGDKVQQSDAFAANLIVEKSDTPGRVNVLYPAILIERLGVLALLFQFRNN